jgi:uncharacterized protein YbjT (DUF2867 family)
MSSYLIVGSGHTSKIVAEKLLAAGKNVTVLGRNPEKLKPLTDKGAKAAVGSLENADFLKEAFKGKDAAYILLPPNYAAEDIRAYQNAIGRNLAGAIKANGTRYVVFLSSVGAHLGNGAGVVDGLGDFEKLLAEIPGLHVKLLRPGFFYYNFFSQIPTLKAAGILGGNYDGNITMPFADTNDIGNAAAEELLKLDFTGQTVRYIASEETTPQQAATILGKAIGKPDLQWVRFPDDQLKTGLLQAGLKETMANGYVQLGKAFQAGSGQEDYLKNKPVLSATKLTEFAKAFAGVYSAS